MLQEFLDKRLCTSGGGSHLELSVRDVLKIFVPFCWTVVGCCLFAFYTIDPVVHMRFPKTLPMYWTLISSLPAFMASLNLFVFHRESVQQTGLSTVALAELSNVMRTISFLGVLAFLILAVASAVQAAQSGRHAFAILLYRIVALLPSGFTVPYLLHLQCRYCDNDNYKESTAWCVVCLFWTALMSWTTPTSRHFSKLIFRFETQQQQAGGSVAIPTLCYTSTEAAPGGPGAVHAFGIGRPGETRPTGVSAAGAGETVFATGYPLEATAFGARTVVGADSNEASLAVAEQEYIRAAAGAPPTQVVAGRVSTKAEGKSEQQ